MEIKDELKEAVEQNKKDRLWFVDFWANYVKTHPDEDWSRQQNVLINSIIGKNAGKTLKIEVLDKHGKATD
ncbi:hypothetical protein HYV82_00565 [Candidatus Woesearchaeota archaeon]|nr:hypothetical protein [Candidatus Woesearchaeota archaeon]